MGFVKDSLGIHDAKSFAFGGKADIGNVREIDNGKAALFGGDLDVLDFGGLQGEQDALDASRLAEEQQLDALGRSITETRRATGEAQGFLEPFGGVGVGAVEQAGFLTDPNAQFDFLQNNPLFQMGLDNANDQTLNLAASRGRLSSGDTLQQLNQNALLTASPLISQQKQSIGDLLNFGSGISRAQANTAIGQGSDVSNLIQGQGNVQSAGTMGRNQIGQDTTANQQQTALSIAAMFSDPALKENKKIIGEKNGFKLWSWDWNKLAKDVLNLTGSSRGVMADEVKLKNPDAVVTFDDGYMRVNYTEIGVKH